ncbi:hypothetical protein BURKHO8Y_140427 [Burkholderia sp. 8Y]|nr:hypothetical protein BURKHO8Y_140427 [Burkholderia sp. 8Y]
MGSQALTIDARLLGLSLMQFGAESLHSYAIFDSLRQARQARLALPGCTVTLRLRR